VVLLTLLLASCGRGNDGARGGPGGRVPGSETPLIPVKVAKAVLDRMDSYVLVNTTLIAERVVNVVAKVSGLVKSIEVEEGDEVRSGDLLAKLDEEELRLELESAKIKFERLEKAFRRAKELFESRMISQEEFEKSKFDYETAKVGYESAKLRLRYASIRSPISGIVIERKIKVGDLVRTNQEVFTVADFKPILAEIHVPEKDIRSIRVGQEAKVTVEAIPDVEFLGRVKRISPVVSPESGTVKVTIEVRDPKRLLKPGMFASVYILVESHLNAVVIPKMALIFGEEGERVFVVRDSVAEERIVKTGFSDRERVEIVSGVEAGELVVTVGQDELRDGMRVRIVSGEGFEVPERAEVKPPAEELPGGKAEAKPPAARPPEGEGGPRPPVMGPPKGKLAALLSNPKVRAEYEKRLKEDPEFMKDPEKRRKFIKEMIEKFGKEIPRPNQKRGPLETR